VTRPAATPSDQPGAVSPTVSRSRSVSRPPIGSADLTEAASQLCAVLEVLPPGTPREVAMARRIEGAVVALVVLSGARQSPNG
jgi:hypothetical protein